MFVFFTSLNCCWKQRNINSGISLPVSTVGRVNVLLLLTVLRLFININVKHVINIPRFCYDEFPLSCFVCTFVCYGTVARRKQRNRK